MGNNADLYAANLESTDLINEAHMPLRLLRFMLAGQNVRRTLAIFSRLVLT